VENITPERIERALYSDILNLSVMSTEYSQFSGILIKETRVLEVSELLRDILNDETTRIQLIDDICRHETVSLLLTSLSFHGEVEAAAV
jgi:arginine deiminase